MVKTPPRGGGAAATACEVRTGGNAAGMHLGIYPYRARARARTARISPAGRGCVWAASSVARMRLGCRPGAHEPGAAQGPGELDEPALPCLIPPSRSVPLHWIRLHQPAREREPQHAVNN